LVGETLKRNEFAPKNGNGSAVEDTPRNRCLEFIKYLVRWENSNNPDYIDPARTLIAAARSSAGKSATEILADCDAAGAQFDANVAGHFGRKANSPP